MLPGRLGGKKLTEELRKLAAEAHTITNDGTPVTREQALSALIWKQALGWVEVVPDEDGNRKEIAHPPVAWCQQFLFERMEGKAVAAQPEETGGIRAAEKVRGLAKERVNALAFAAKKSGPPSHKPKGAT